MKYQPENSNSFKMDPGDIERIRHHSQIYTVVSKSYKQGGSKREGEPAQMQLQKASSDVHDVGAARSKLKSQRSSMDLMDGALPSPSSRPTPPAHPHHHQRQQHQQGAKYSVGGKKDEPNQYPQSSHPLPPPHILQKQKNDVELVTCTPSVPTPRARSVSLLDMKYESEYDIIDKETSPVSSEGSSPLHQGGGADREVGQALGVKQGQLNRSHGELDMQQLQHRMNKPIPAARHNKKHELHLKYTKIREQMMQKQVSEETGATGGGGGAEGTNGSKVKPRVSLGQPYPNKKLKHGTSYAEVDSELEITVEPIDDVHGQSELWGLVRYPQPRKTDSMGQRSSSSSNLTSSDFYSNLTDLELDPPSEGQQEWSGSESRRRRSHSFSEGLDKMVISVSSGSRSVWLA